MTRAIFLMADYGHDPTETAIPWSVFRAANITTHFATETGNPPKCDFMMLQGWTGSLLGAPAAAKTTYRELEASAEFTKPLSWNAQEFSLKDYDIVFLPGGHEKRVSAIIDSKSAHKLLAEYFPLTKKTTSAGPPKVLAAICHGVMVLSSAQGSDGKSLLDGVTTTGLPHMMEQGIFWATRPFLGDYYKTYGAGSESVETSVTKCGAVWKGSMGLSP
jgi:putative intracellular protease/amidase